MTLSNQLGNRQSNQARSNLKLAWRPSDTHKLTLEAIVNRSIDTPYHHMWSRRGFVALTHDTIRAAGLPVRVGKGAIPPKPPRGSRDSSGRRSRITKGSNSKSRRRNTNARSPP